MGCLTAELTLTADQINAEVTPIETIALGSDASTFDRDFCHLRNQRADTGIVRRLGSQWCCSRFGPLFCGGKTQSVFDGIGFKKLGVTADRSRVDKSPNHSTLADLQRDATETAEALRCWR